MNLNKLLSIGKIELVISLLTFVLVFLLVLSSRTGRLTSEESIIFESETELILPEPIMLDALQDTLKNHGVEIKEEELKWAARLLGWKRFQTGRYSLEGNYSYNALLSKLARGIQDPVSVTILPGITRQRFTENLSEEFRFSQEEFTEVMEDSAFLAENDLSPEQLFGRMLPETYLMYWTSSPTDVRNKILREFENLVAIPFEDRLEELDITLDEAVAMASIIEWEATDPEEKPVISGLYWNRLNRGMLLQADPTVNFVVGERRRLLFEDYQIEHPYNTYVNTGLPPGPITNPSISSIRAALYPQDHNYLYMVASPDGGHVFTRTFEEHKIESEKWRKWLRRQYQIKQQREAEEQSEEENSPE